MNHTQYTTTMPPLTALLITYLTNLPSGLMKVRVWLTHRSNRNLTLQVLRDLKGERRVRYHHITLDLIKLDTNNFFNQFKYKKLPLFLQINQDADWTEWGSDDHFSIKIEPSTPPSNQPDENKASLDADDLFKDMTPVFKKPKKVSLLICCCLPLTVRIVWFLWFGEGR